MTLTEQVEQVQRDLAAIGREIRREVDRQAAVVARVLAGLLRRGNRA